MKENPFRKRLPRRAERTLRKTVWKANEYGEDSSEGKITLTASADYLWLAQELSIPLVWIKSVYPMGPGMAIAWENPKTDEMEVAFICIRTFFGYNTKSRNELVSQLVSLVESARAIGPSPEIQIAESIPTCQQCGTLESLQFEFIWVLNILTFHRSQTKRELLCREHGARRLAAIMCANALGGTLGTPGVISTPQLVHRQGSEGVAAGLIPRWVHVVFLGLSLLPLLGCLVLIGWLISAALKR